MKKYNAHMDKSMKYAFATLGGYIHEFFELEGEFLHDMGTEVITVDKRNLRMDIVYYRSGNIINNIENQTKLVDEEKLEVIAEYAKFLLINNSALVNSYIVSKVDPKDCLKEIKLTETLILRPGWLYKSEEELLELLNTIKYKIKSNKDLSRMETIALAMIPTLAQDNIAEEVTEDVCHLINKDHSIDLWVKNDICFIVDIMVDRNIKDEKKKQELWEVLDMEKRKSNLEAFLEQETKELREDNNNLKEDNKNKDEQIQKMDKALHKKDAALLKKDEALLKKDGALLMKDEEIQKMRNKINKLVENINNSDKIDSNEKSKLLCLLAVFE